MAKSSCVRVDTTSRELCSRAIRPVEASSDVAASMATDILLASVVVYVSWRQSKAVQVCMSSREMLVVRSMNASTWARQSNMMDTRVAEMGVWRAWPWSPISWAYAPARSPHVWSCAAFGVSLSSEDGVKGTHSPW